MDSTAKQARLVELLHSNTTAGKLEWTRASGPPAEAFQTVLGTRRVWLGEAARPTGPDMVVRIYNEDGSVLDEVAAVDLGSVPLNLTDAADWASLMRRTVQLAGRQLSGADQAVDDVIGELTRKLG